MSDLPRQRYLMLTLALYVENSQPAFIQFYTPPALFYPHTFGVANNATVLAVQTAAMNTFNKNTSGNKALGAVLMGAPLIVDLNPGDVATAGWHVLAEAPAPLPPITPAPVPPEASSSTQRDPSA